MSKLKTVEEQIDTILAFGYTDPTFITDIHTLIGGKKQVDTARSAIHTLTLDARLVELDLFEQFLGQHENKAITRADLYQFKLQRLKDLTDRLNATKVQP